MFNKGILLASKGKKIYPEGYFLITPAVMSNGEDRGVDGSHGVLEPLWEYEDRPYLYISNQRFRVTTLKTIFNSAGEYFQDFMQITDRQPTAEQIGFRAQVKIWGIPNPRGYELTNNSFYFGKGQTTGYEVYNDGLFPTEECIGNKYYMYVGSNYNAPPRGIYKKDSSNSSSYRRVA